MIERVCEKFLTQNHKKLQRTIQNRRKPNHINIQIVVLLLTKKLKPGVFRLWHLSGVSILIIWDGDVGCEKFTPRSLLWDGPGRNAGATLSPEKKCIQSTKILILSKKQWNIFHRLWNQNINVLTNKPESLCNWVILEAWEKSSLDMCLCVGVHSKSKNM